MPKAKVRTSRQSGVDEVAVGIERGTSFGFEDIFSGWEDGKVFHIEEGMPKDFKQMLDTDGKAQGIENLLTFPIISAPREIQPGKGDKGEAEKIREILTAYPYEDGMTTPLEMILSQMTAAFTYKRTYHELVFKEREDGLIGYEKIAWRPPETCELALDDKTGEYAGFRQRKFTYSPKISAEDLGWVEFEPKEALVYIHGVWRDPIEGTSALQVPFWCFKTKQKIRWLWYNFLETNLLPKTIVKNPDEARAREDARKVATLRNRGVLGMESSTELGTLESAGHGATGYIEAIRFLDTEMSQSVLGGFMDLTAQAASGKGSYALSADQSKLFLRSERVKARDLARQFNEQVIAPLVRYNFGRNAAFPQLVFGALSEADEQLVISTFEKLAASPRPAVPNEFYDELVVRVATLLELDEDKIAKAIETEGSPLEKMLNAATVAAGAVEADQAQQNGQGEISAEQFLAEAEARSSNGSR